MERILPVTRLGDFLQTLVEHGYRVVVPVSGASDIEFADYDAGKAVTLSGRTRFSAKEFFFPAQETLLVFDERRKKEGEGSLVSLPMEETAHTFVFGVRPCDLAGFRVLDRVFLSDPVDGHYAQRREMTLLGCLACNQPGPHCFCTSLGVGPHKCQGSDVAFYDLGDSLLVMPLNERGESVLGLGDGLFEGATKEDIERAEALGQAASKSMSRSLDLNGLVGALPGSWDSDIWQEAAAKCTICGTCSIVCPACHCFNIEDLMKRRGVTERVRYWDNCQFSGFTRMVAVNSRPEQWQRWRHKIYDKFIYKPEKLGGLLGCTGCGRCIEFCQGGIDLVGVLKRLTND